jgi:hypothetical protein
MSSRVTPRLERGAIVVVPLVAVATLAIGLRIGASPPVRAAVVFGAPPSAERAGLSWQVMTLLDDRGVREAISLPAVSVVARAGGNEARWDGATNSEGFAEVWLALPGVSPTTPIAIAVTTPGEKAPLASGMVAWPTNSKREVETAPVFARPSKQSGPLMVDVAVYGGRLVPGFSGDLWVRVRDRSTGAPSAGTWIVAEPEPGLSMNRVHVTTEADGWAELHATPEIHVVALGLAVTSKTTGVPIDGDWYGALPVAPGAAFVEMPMTIPAGEPHSFDVDVPTVLPRIYTEVDDASGRAYAASLPVERTANGAHARFDVRPLTPGDYWLVTAGAPRAAELLEGSAVARPFVVTSDPGTTAPNLGPRLAALPPPAFSRFVALDGLPGKRHADGGRHRRGLLLAFGSLVIAAALEALLILRGVERARREIARVAAMLDEQQSRLERRFSATSVVIGLLLALLGFALLAVLLTWKAS